MSHVTYHLPCPSTLPLHSLQRAAKTKGGHTAEPGLRRRESFEALAPAAAPAPAAAAPEAAPGAASGDAQARTSWMQDQPPPPVGWEWPREGEKIEVEAARPVEKGYGPWVLRKRTALGLVPVAWGRLVLGGCWEGGS